MRTPWWYYTASAVTILCAAMMLVSWVSVRRKQRLASKRVTVSKFGSVSIDGEHVAQFSSFPRALDYADWINKRLEK